MSTSHEHRYERLVITVDGPAGTGKSSVSRQLATTLGLSFLDTGAMYRAATAIAIDAGLTGDDGIAEANHERIAELVRNADLRFDWSHDPPILLAHGEPIDDTRLRSHEVSAMVSKVSAIAQVREVLVEKQRRIGEAHPRLVSEGRDQGSVVFYNAEIKVYLDASPRIRAQRRAAQLGSDANLDEIEAQIMERDRIDSTRAVGPMVCPPDAHRVMTDNTSQEEVVAKLAALVEEHAPALALSGCATG